MFLVSSSCFQFLIFRKKKKKILMPSLQDEKLNFCYNVVDVRMVLCLVELITC